jgi:arylsulfatase A-like enzyme
LLDLGSESKATLERYRVGQSFQAGTCKGSDFGRQCLLARRFCEAGVRFIEITHGSWDQHTDHRRDLTANCATTDAPIAALLDDLDERGLLDDTLVVWGGEFGRPGLKPGEDKDQTGHQHRAFTFWMAGGGVKAGYTHGSTNENGSECVEGRVHFRDLHATILHQLGLDHENLAVVSGGRRIRLTGLQGGNVVKEILA